MPAVSRRPGTIMNKPRRVTVGLALGSGGGRGLAHIGVIEVLERHNIPIDFIAGSSVGAMIGGLYASGVTTNKMQQIALSTDWWRIVSVLSDPSLRRGLISGERATAFIERHLFSKDIEDCLIPFAAVATDLATGESVSLDKGSAASAIRASISIPLAFAPVEIGGRLLADGGLSAPVPVDVVRAMGADVVLAVNLDRHYAQRTWNPGWYGIADRSLTILIHHLALRDVARADVVMDVEVERGPWFQFTNGLGKIRSGERAAEEVVPQLEALLCEQRSPSRTTRAV